jgi:hypothetical protein
MAKQQKTSYPASRVAVEARSPAARSEGFAGASAVGAMAPVKEAPPGPRVTGSQPSAEVVPREVEAAVGVWQQNKRVSALWGTDESRNSWVLISGIGWKRLSAGSDSAALALTTLASIAKMTQARVDYREESDGCIHELYLW